MKNKSQDPMPPPYATPEEIGEFWDTHDLTDYQHIYDSYYGEGKSIYT